MPRKGHRFEGSEGGSARARRRRRLVFIALLDVGALTLIMGLFPPFRRMLYGTAAVAGLLLVYMSLLVRLRAGEVERALARRRMRVAAIQQRGVRTAPYSAASRRTNGKGHADRIQGVRDMFADRGVQMIEDDVHVIVRRSDEIDVAPLRKAAQ